MQPTKNALEFNAGFMGWEPIGSWLLFVPYWLILLTVAAIWLLLLFMRARRRNKSVMKP